MSTQLSKLPNKLKSLGYNSYQEYLESPHWQEVKVKFFKRGKIQRQIRKYGHPICMVCKSPFFLNLHHLSYKRIGKERMGDLILLCRDCHKNLHSIYKTGNWWRKGLWKLTYRAIHPNREIHKKLVFQREKNLLPLDN